MFRCRFTICHGERLVHNINCPAAIRNRCSLYRNRWLDQSRAKICRCFPSAEAGKSTFDVTAMRPSVRQWETWLKTNVDKNVSISSVRTQSAKLATLQRTRMYILIYVVPYKVLTQLSRAQSSGLPQSVSASMGQRLKPLLCNKSEILGLLSEGRKPETVELKNVFATRRNAASAAAHTHDCGYLAYPVALCCTADLK